jgi:hypothetical protein
MAAFSTFFEVPQMENGWKIEDGKCTPDGVTEGITVNATALARTHSLLLVGTAVIASCCQNLDARSKTSRRSEWRLTSSGIDSGGA